ncbi:MAG: hypothetical protein JRH13_11075 [Deltaproteobacteria bacterium]|nr:hypothetical protein [Deltaproteobacteria bacterium]MBW2129894.1 hypothetical protein [Deltaproteobacteria bacterium]
MPLGFQSLNHGTIAFGFFNIDTDLLLLEHYFLFAPEFCEYMVQASREEKIRLDFSWEVYDIPAPDRIGDLAGAIHGTHYVGFIGEVYRLFPFPDRQEEFKQKPGGYQNRSRIEPLIQDYAIKTAIPFQADQEKNTVSIGEYIFEKTVFHELVRYVWLGGYPRWRDGIRPDYVEDMRSIIVHQPGWLFTGLRLEDDLEEGTH